MWGIVHFQPCLKSSKPTQSHGCSHRGSAWPALPQSATWKGKKLVLEPKKMITASPTWLKGKPEGFDRWSHSWDLQWRAFSLQLGLSGGELDGPFWCRRSTSTVSTLPLLVLLSLHRVGTCLYTHLKYQVCSVPSRYLNYLPRSENHFTYVVHTFIQCK